MKTELNYLLLSKTPNVVIDLVPYGHLQPVLATLAALNRAEEKFIKAQKEKDELRMKLEEELDKCFGKQDVALRTEMPERFGSEFNIADGGYLLLRTKSVTRRVLNRSAIENLLGDQIDLCYKNEIARGSVQTGKAIQAVIDSRNSKSDK